MGGYDLYGQYYPKMEDAINAEMTQCNEIDIRYMERDMQRNSQVYSQYLQEQSWDVEQLKYQMRYALEPYLWYKDEQEKHLRKL